MFESLFKIATEEKKKPSEDEVNNQKKKVKKRKRGKKKTKNSLSDRKETTEIKTQKKPTPIDRVNSNGIKKSSKKQKAPSQEALELSAKLKQLCQQKNLSEAIRIFKPSEDEVNNQKKKVPIFARE